MLEIKDNNQIQQKFFVSASFILIFLFICRIIANYVIPLNDSTEARYGEIARKMLETKNWVTLQHDYGVPFWAKPPLSTWLSALSMKLFGVNEFAARLPGLILSLGILWLIWDLAKKQSGSVVAMFSVLVLSGTLYFFLDAGAVMTDPSLLFCTTLSIVAFWHAVAHHSKSWSYVFFIGLGFGLLAKGPIAIVLVAMPLFFWVLLRKQWLNLWQRLPWIKGTFLMSLIALPWYILAEIRTPGFLNYFIVGEHIHRFLTPGWTGDRYGMAHDAPKGMIWLYAVIGIFPWCIPGAIGLVTQRKNLITLIHDDDGWISYIFLCMIVPLCFFTFAGNIIYPYVFPSLPAFALFYSELWNRANHSLNNSQWILRLPLVTGLFFLSATSLFVFYPEMIAKTQKPVVRAWINQHPVPGSSLIYWDYKTEFSAQFYTAGKVKYARNTNDLCKLLSNNSENYLAINAQDVSEIPTTLFAKFTLVDSIMYKENKTLLVHCPVINC